MTTWIALFRGINVGGKNAVPMKRLRELLQDLNLENVRTYIQSGNCVFESEEKNRSEHAATIAGAMEKEFGFRPEVMVISRAELEKAVAANPFSDSADDPKSTHLFFLPRRPDNPGLDKLRSVQKPNERFKLSNRVFYLHAPEGVGRSKLAALVEKSLGVAVTARNFRSAQKILELAAPA